MTIRVTLAKGFVTVAEAATDVADKLLRREAKVAYTKIDARLTGAEEAARAARLRAEAAERRAAEKYQADLAALNSKLEDYSYAIPAGKSPDGGE